MTTGFAGSATHLFPLSLIVTRDLPLIPLENPRDRKVHLALKKLELSQAVIEQKQKTQRQHRGGRQFNYFRR